MRKNFNTQYPARAELKSFAAPARVAAPPSFWTELFTMLAALHSRH